MRQQFVPGLELARRFYQEAVEPLLHHLLHHCCGDLSHTAALIGPGSEVLGFDTERSTDHCWGPRLQLFLSPVDYRRHGEKIVIVLAEHLPETFLGYSATVVPLGEVAPAGPVQSGVVVTSLEDWFADELGFDPRAEVTLFDWLATPTQALAEFTAGEVFHDGLSELEPVRQRLAWYPDDIWRYVLACQWQRISQEEAFVGRSGEVGDELGSAIVAACLARDLMRLCLLMARRYPPYSKWLGSAFAQLPCARELAPALTAALGATRWRDRERHLAVAYETVASMHNALGLTDPVDPRTRPYHDRPFRVLHAERFAAALLAGITDESLLRIPVIGAIDQFVDSTDVLCRCSLARDLTQAVCPPGRRS